MTRPAVPSGRVYDWRWMYFYLVHVIQHNLTWCNGKIGRHLSDNKITAYGQDSLKEKSPNRWHLSKSDLISISHAWCHTDIIACTPHIGMWPHDLIPKPPRRIVGCIRKYKEYQVYRSREKERHEDSSPQRLPLCYRHVDSLETLEATITCRHSRVCLLVLLGKQGM